MKPAFQESIQSDRCIKEGSPRAGKKLLKDSPYQDAKTTEHRAF